MRSHGPRLVSLFIFVGAALIASCSKPYHEKNERYVFVATNINLPYWQQAALEITFSAWVVVGTPDWSRCPFWLELNTSSWLFGDHCASSDA